MRASTLQNTNLLAVNREIGSKYDVVLAVKEKLPQIELVAGMDITGLIQELENAQDFTGITVVIGTVPSWDPINKILTVTVEKGDKGDQGLVGPQGPVGPIGPQGLRGLTGPKGKDGLNGKDGINGINGLNGMTPIIEFSMDADANLMYEVIGYEEGPTMGERFPVQEW
jgi:hypothetical protein